MEKFYIVTNQNFLHRVDMYKKNSVNQSKFVKNFFAEKGISGTGYYLRGDGVVNKPFSEHTKDSIVLYIEGTPENNTEFGKQLLKPRAFSDGSELRAFRKTSKILKEFQDRCVESQIVINLHFPYEWEYFKELRFGGCRISRFEYQDKYYLKITTDYATLTPSDAGFEEIKASEYYAAHEAKEAA